MSNAGSASLGASPKVLPLDISSGLPIMFEAAFLAAYPTMGTRSFVSRTIVAIEEGTLTYIDTQGAHVEWPMAAGEANAIQAVGIYASDGIDTIKVML